MKNALKNFHALEDHMIQIEYLIKTLQKVVEDDGRQICLTNIIEEKITALRTIFYEAWKDL